MRLIFLGTPEFAVPSLEALNSHPDIDVALVVSQPDRPSGRGRKVRAPAVKDAAERLGLPVFQPETLRDDAAIERLGDATPDVLVVVSYGEILRKAVLELAPFDCLNVHPSLLPKYRGPTPIPAAILNGDVETGVSIMRLMRRLDAGPLIAQTAVPLDGDETTGSLTASLADLAARKLPDVVVDWVAGRVEESPQDHEGATYTRELRKGDAQIDWREPAVAIECFIRAMDPWPRAWTAFNGQRLGIISVQIHASALSGGRPGTATLTDRGALVTTGSGMIELVTVQPPGKKPMPAEDWARGLQDTSELQFASPEAVRERFIFTRPQ